MENELSYKIIGAAIEVQRTLGGPGLLESMTQVLTYLRLAGKKLGLVINFGNPCVGDGISRVVNGL